MSQTGPAVSNFFDSQETQSTEAREAALFEKIGPHLEKAIRTCPGLREHLGKVSPGSITSRALLADLPILRKDIIIESQKKNPPFGGYVDPTLLQGSRIFMSPGPVWEPQAPKVDPWASSRALYAAGIRSGDRVHNAFSYHLTPGGFILDEGARALGCVVFPAGVGATDSQIEAARFYRPDAYVGTPDFLKVLLDRALETGEELSSIKKALVSGGALFPSMRTEYTDRGVSVRQCYATADIGVIAYESECDGTLVEGMVCNEDLIIEIVRPGTSEVLPDGEVGELVITTFNSAYPLVRFGTGDLSAVLEGQSPCGRTGTRLRGWMGRADQRTKVKGMFVDPKQVAEIINLHPGISKARLVVSRSDSSDRLELLYEGEFVNCAELESTMQRVLNLKGSVTRAESALPNDGLVIVDERDY